MSPAGLVSRSDRLRRSLPIESTTMKDRVDITIISRDGRDKNHYTVIDLNANANFPPDLWILTAQRRAVSVWRDHLADYTSREEAIEQYGRLMQGGVWYQTDSTFERAQIL